MTATNSATKDDKKLINKLTVSCNRTREALITTELIQINSDTSALKYVELHNIREL
jgi:F0F1-type ATP synthase gamma subunit